MQARAARTHLAQPLVSSRPVSSRPAAGSAGGQQIDLPQPYGATARTCSPHPSWCWAWASVRPRRARARRHMTAAGRPRVCRAHIYGAGCVCCCDVAYMPIGSIPCGALQRRVFGLKRCALCCSSKHNLCVWRRPVQRAHRSPWEARPRAAHPPSQTRGFQSPPHIPLKNTSCQHIESVFLLRHRVRLCENQLGLCSTPPHCVLWFEATVFDRSRFLPQHRIASYVALIIGDGSSHLERGLEALCRRAWCCC